MECTCHERVIIRRVAEYNQLRTAEGIIVLRCLCGCHNHLAHQTDCIHVKTCLGRTDIDGAAHTVGAGKCLRDRADQKLFRRCHSLGNQCGIAADKVDAYFFRCLIKCFRNLYKILALLAGASTYQRDRSNRDTFIDDRNPKFTSDGIAGRYKIFRISCNLIVDLLIHLRQITVHTV